MTITDDEYRSAALHLETIYRDLLSRAPTITFVDPLGHGRWHAEYQQLRLKGQSHEQAIFNRESTIRAIVGLPRPTPPPPPPRTTMLAGGELRLGPNATFADAHGPRRVRFASWFPAVCVMADNSDFANQQLDRIAQSYHGVRVFWHLAHPEFWKGRNLDVNVSRNEDHQRAFDVLQAACKDRGLVISLSAGDLQFLHDKRSAFQLTARQCTSVVQLTGMVNEARVNSDEGEDWGYWASLAQEWRRLHNMGQIGLSDPGDMEEPDALRAASAPPATVALLHGTRRSWIDACRRAFNVRYEGNIGKSIVQDEPSGLGPLVYQPLADKQELFGLYTLITITGQLLTHFCSESLEVPGPDTFLDRRWGFHELPQLWADVGIPEDIGTYMLRPGHRRSSALGMRSFEDPGGSGPSRCDGAQHDERGEAFFVAYGGRGAWEPVSQLWDVDYTYVRADGPYFSGKASAGETLKPISSAEKTHLIVLRRR